MTWNRRVVFVALSLSILVVGQADATESSLTETQKIFVQENQLAAVATEKCTGFVHDYSNSWQRMGSVHFSDQQLEAVTAYSDAIEPTARAMYEKDPEAFCATALKEFGPTGKRLIKLQ